VAIVAEDEQSLSNAQKVATTLRNENIIVEMFVSGSPRKRRDKAIKFDPECIVTLRADMAERGFQLTTSGDGSLNRRIEPLITAAIGR
jgi:histidyl-tRNA synthetase